MNIYYLDASAWLKRYIREDGTAFVQKLFSKENLLACSSLGFVEVIATLSRKLKAKEISLFAFEEKVREAENDWMKFAHIEIDMENITAAISLAKKHFLRGADAIHLSAALSLKLHFSSSQDSFQFISSDDELNNAAKEYDMNVVNPARV
ncbi:MAG: type II toxin-antitoxin system VapC family toxin [Ignavibacteria bacterium]|nr:type II toxin-antitoxin system VapC family toxin [Ignavibacteria bacterium]